AGPATPLVVERDAGVHHRAPLRQEDVLDRPVETAGRAHPGDVPAPLDDLRFRTREDSAPVDRGTIRTPTWLGAVENLKAGQHPGAFLTTSAERPATGDLVATIDGDRPAASLHGSPGDGDIAPMPIILLDALVRQPQRDELGVVVVADVPADRAGALGQHLDDAEVRERVGLQPAQLPWSHEPVEAGGMELLDQRLRQALLSLHFIAITADERP